MNVPPKSSRLNLQFEAVIQKINEAMEAMVWGLIAAIDQWILAIDDLNRITRLLQGGEVRVVIP
jgi:hypothetical protein